MSQNLPNTTRISQIILNRSTLISFTWRKPNDYNNGDGNDVIWNGHMPWDKRDGGIVSFTAATVTDPSPYSPTNNHKRQLVYVSS
jgi:hypothetical protein